MGGRFLPLIRRVSIATSAMLLLPAIVFAQSPWERAASNLALTFTGPLARSLALVAIVIGGLMFMFVALYAFALWATKRDPQMLRILLSSSRFRTRYDAAKHDRFDVEVRTC